jgi:hypothetical protein
VVSHHTIPWWWRHRGSLKRWTSELTQLVTKEDFITFTRGPRWLLPSNSAPGLQYGSGPFWPFSDFLAKILGADTPPFLWKKQFYFPLSSLLLHTLVTCIKSLHLFSIFLYSHSKITGAQFVSQVLWLKLNYYYVTPFQNVSLTIWPIALIFLSKSLFYFSMTDQ